MAVSVKVRVMTVMVRATARVKVRGRLGSGWMRRVRVIRPVGGGDQGQGNPTSTD